MPKKKKKVVIGMSGGVDSAVAAALLLSQGYEVVGVFMQFWFPTGVKYGENRCCSLESFNSAQEVADSLGIKIHKLNVGQEFKSKIVDEFLSAYGAYKTPNPCVSCNKFIKFDLFLKKALRVFEADFIATGHYAKVRKIGRKYQLLRSNDKNKDQSYFLYNLNQDILKHVIFPIGRYQKSHIRKLAKKFNLSIHDKKDSQEICFVGNSHYDFLKRYLKLKPGDIVAETGQKIGEHQGLPLYTIGQRSGLGLSGGPWYVVRLDKINNRLVVTKDQSKSEIFSNTLLCHKLNWVLKEPKLPFKCQAQIRYRGQAEECVLKKSGHFIKVEFKKPERAIAPGQSVVFYKRNQVLGGGVIK
ncbi:MAG: tRNA 2-thiouridine(34) synthase MnmA [Candidatus Buchananbacteria bacterium]|nr:tRNA 2-thiouridine(34) synthase MnmA [Candidatus Buchananbacteria bacterium]